LRRELHGNPVIWASRAEFQGVPHLYFTSRWGWGQMTGVTAAGL
jgi:hypothetical protein